MAAAIDSDDKVIGWRHRSVSPTLFSTFAPDSGYTSFLEAGMGLVDTPIDVANLSIEAGKAMSHTRIGWFRSVSNVPRAFAVQSFVAELAEELGRDPKDMLLELIGPARVINPAAVNMPDDLWNYGEPYVDFPNDTGRLRNVVELAAQKAGWGKNLPAGEGFGIAAHRSFVSYVASVVHVKISADGSIAIPEVHMAYSGLHYENGAVKESNYHDYPMARISAYPEKVRTHIVEHPFSVHATGVGEPGLPPFAPALANAIFAATGKRLRDMPFGDTIA